MNTPYALFRLYWRPAALAMIWFVLLASAWPLLRLEHHPGGPFGGIWNNGSSALTRSAAWQLVALLSASLGSVTAMARAEVSVSGLGWWVPGIRRAWLAGALAISAPVAAGLGWLISRGGPVSVALAATGLSLFWFSVPGALNRAGERLPIRLLLGLLLLLAVMLPARAGALVATWPIPTALVAVAGAVVLLRHQFSAASARRHRLSVDRGGGPHEGGIWSPRSGSGHEWRRSLSTDRTLPWLHAFVFEAGKGKSSRYLRGLLLGAAIIVGGAAFLEERWAVAMFIGLSAAARPPAIQSTLYQPRSRRQRARLALSAVVGENLLVLALVAMLLAIVGAVRAWSGGSGSAEDGAGSWIPVLLVAFIWLPIAMWGSIVARPMTIPPLQTGVGRRFFPVLGYMVPVVLLLGARGEGWWSGGTVAPWSLAGIAVFAALTTYGALWWATKRHYNRRDLSPGAD